MTGQLKKLSDFLTTYVSTGNVRSDKKEDDRKYLSKVFSDIRKRLEYRISYTKSNKALSIFIRLTQLQLTERADLAYENYLIHEQDNSDIARTFHEIHDKLVDLLLYLYKNHTGHFDFSLSIPKGLDQASVEKEESQLLTNNFAKKGIDQNLLDFLEDLLIHKEDAEEIRTWAHLEYRSKVIRQLKDIVRYEDGDADCNLSVIEALVACNVNSITFYNYMLRYIDEILEANTTFEDKEEELEKLLRKMERIRKLPVMAYNPRTPHIRDSAISCIRYELERLKRIMESEKKWKSNKDDAGKNSYYFYVAVTIEELLLMAWLMIEVGFIKTVKHSHLYAFVQRHIRTERTTNPSPHYMRNRFGPKNVSSKTIRNVRAWLMLMVNHIDKRWEK